MVKGPEMSKEECSDLVGEAENVYVEWYVPPNMRRGFMESRSSILIASF